MSEESRRAQMERRLLQRSIEDEDFRQRLLEDPRAALEEELGARLPAEIQVQVVEETADTIYLVLPSAPPIGEAGELSERQLEALAGGEVAWSWDPNVPSCGTMDYSP
jgi:hypothetical protein